jgi:UPF0176 protein
MPITEADKASEHYEHGVSCPHCYDKVSAEDKARFAEREKQMQLARLRGEAHIGTDAARSLQAKRAEKVRRLQMQKLNSQQA